MDVKVARTAEHSADAAVLMRGLVASNKERYPDRIDELDAYYRDAWFLQDTPRIPPIYTPPRGEVLLAYEGEAAVGTVAIKPMDTACCELKSMFVLSSWRGQGVARRLCEEILAVADTLGYRRVRLSTGNRQDEARGLYQRLGFRSIPPWADDLPKDVFYFEMAL